jgi:hypothetical protein
VGASNREAVTSTVEPSLGLEDLVVGLLRLTAPVEARLFKLVVRVLQSGKVSAPRLHLLARRERVDHVVHWLVGVVPARERTPAFEVVAKAFDAPPRGYRGMNYRYDALRLVRRPATRESLWHVKQR